MQQAQLYLNKQLENTLQNLNYPTVAYQFDRPKQEAHGDISINVAMLLTKELRKNPREIAGSIVGNLELDPQIISNTDIAGPGFINFFLAENFVQKTVAEVLTQKENFGRFTTGNGLKAQVEFVSANPTGPLTVGHGRQAVLGDTVANMLEWLGYEVSREYYFNNAGRQMRMLAESVKVRYRQILGEDIDFPDDYYQGEYIKDIAKLVLETHGPGMAKNDDLNIFQATAESEIFKDIKKTLASFGVIHDSFFNESDLYENSEIDRIIRELKEKNLAYDADGATWLKTTELGLDQDRVIVKSTGEPTYRLPDIAYHISKFERGFDKIIDIFGADHIATYPDVLAGLKAFGYDTEKVKVLIHQFVTLFEGKEKVKMSTRKANYVTLDELVDEVGADITRWYFLMRSMQSHLNFDLKLAKDMSNANPALYSHYAHARICSILRTIAEKNIKIDEVTDLSCIKHPSELALLKKMMLFPQTVFQSATDAEPHLLIQYMSDLSKAFHRFYTDCHVISEDNMPLTQARLSICLAVKVVLSNGFKILGVSAPERM